MQCNNCLQLNHTKKWCKNAEVCSSCGERGHKSVDCTKVACVNCLTENDHVSKDRRCPMYQFEKRLNIYAQKTNITKGAARSYAMHTVSKYARLMAHDEASTTYAGVLKAFANRGAVAVQNRPPTRESSQPMRSVVLPKDTKGNDIKSLDNVSTTNYMETMMLNMRMPPKIREKSKQGASTAGPDKRSSNRPAAAARPSPYHRPKSHQKSKNLNYERQDESEAEMELDDQPVVDLSNS